jgi:SAM-dependent methyltransferase
MTINKARSQNEELLISAYNQLSKTLESQPEIVSLLDKIDLTVHEKDNMLHPTLSSAKHYLNVGLSAINCIEKAISRSRIDNKNIRNILDLPCGFGRVLRAVKARFPNSQLHACELIPQAVEFCQNTFNTVPIISNTDLSKLKVSQKFDLIWSGSFITHLNKESTRSVLKFFYEQLSPEGLCVFTTHGIGSVSALEQGERQYGLTGPQITELLNSYQESTYGYVSYNSQTNYGISLSTTQKILEMAYDTGDWLNVYFEQEGWDNHQDVFVFQKH